MGIRHVLLVAGHTSQCPFPLTFAEDQGGRTSPSQPNGGEEQPFPLGSFGGSLD